LFLTSKPRISWPPFSASRIYVTQALPSTCKSTCSSKESKHNLACSQLHSLRPALPDVPAIYFVSPTLPNVRRIAQDLQKGLYESYHLNFVEPLPRALLEELASLVAQDGTAELIEQVRFAFISS
jgi:hypothetical protein